MKKKIHLTHDYSQDIFSSESWIKTLPIPFKKKINFKVWGLELGKSFHSILNSKEELFINGFCTIKATTIRHLEIKFFPYKQAGKELVKEENKKNIQNIYIVRNDTLDSFTGIKFFIEGILIFPKGWCEIDLQAENISLEFNEKDLIHTSPNNYRIIFQTCMNEFSNNLQL